MTPSHLRLLSAISIFTGMLVFLLGEVIKHLNLLRTLTANISEKVPFQVVVMPNAVIAARVCFVLLVIFAGWCYLVSRRTAKQ